MDVGTLNQQVCVSEVAFGDALMVLVQRLSYMAFKLRYSAPGSGPDEAEVNSILREVFTAAGVQVVENLFESGRPSFDALINSLGNEHAVFRAPVGEPVTMFIPVEDLATSVPEPVLEATEPFQPVWEADPNSTKFIVNLTGGELDAVAEPAVGPEHG